MASPMPSNESTPAELAERLRAFYQAAMKVLDSTDEEIIAHMLALEQNELLERIAICLEAWIGPGP